MSGFELSKLFFLKLNTQRVGIKVRYASGFPGFSFVQIRDHFALTTHQEFRPTVEGFQKGRM